jgi:hypothetical protein
VKIQGYLLFLFGLFSFKVSGQVLVFQHQAPQINHENWIDMGFRYWKNPQHRKGFFKYDSLYLLSYRDSLGATISATPIAALWAGTEQGKDGLIYQNSRGLMVTAGYNRFSCYAMIMENQAFLPDYQTQFIKTHGEFYPGTNAYNQQNGMVPGGGRTKPFKNNGFDYAFSQGGLEWGLSKRITVFGGNGNLRIGEGLRSLFWSNHNQALLMGTTISITPHLQYIFTKGRLFDLIRKPKYANVESPYYKKGYSMSALICSKKKLRAGIVYQNIWEGGDSLRERPFSPLFWIPIGGFDRLAKNRASLPQWGFVGQYKPISSMVFFGEAFLRGFQRNSLSYQAGVNYSPNLKGPFAFNVNLAFIHVGSCFYGVDYSLSFTTNNLPLGSLLGNGTQEILLSGKLNYRRLYLDILLQYYTSETGKNVLFKPTYTAEKEVIHPISEFGFLVNPITQCTIFALCDFRRGNSSLQTLVFSLGIKTAIFPNRHVY